MSKPQHVDCDVDTCQCNEAKHSRWLARIAAAGIAPCGCMVEDDEGNVHTHALECPEHPEFVPTRVDIVMACGHGLSAPAAYHGPTAVCALCGPQIVIERHPR